MLYETTASVEDADGSCYRFAIRSHQQRGMRGCRGWAPFGKISEHVRLFGWR